jgi:hypothetical protein
MVAQNEWKPDEKYLKYLERHWIRCGCDLDKEIFTPSISLRGITVRKFLEASESEEYEEIQYLKNNFNLDLMLTTGPITLRKSLEEMRKGNTALGVLNYFIGYRIGGWQNLPGFIEE